LVLIFVIVASAGVLLLSLNKNCLN
jgi:hypothetical protein